MMDFKFKLLNGNIAFAHDDVDQTIKLILLFLLTFTLVYEVRSKSEIKSPVLEGT